MAASLPSRSTTPPCAIPKDGGNSFEGFLAGAFTNHKLQSKNLTDDLQAQGLSSVDRVNYIYDFNPAAVLQMASLGKAA